MVKETQAKSEDINLADIQAMLEEAKKAKEEALKILADAKASVKGELTEEQKKAIEEENAYWDELVEVELFKDNNKYKDDVFVAVNGETCGIKRGEKGKVKRKFADVLENSRKQDFATSNLIDRKSNEFAKSNF